MTEGIKVAIASDILMEYQALCSQLSDLLLTLSVALTEDDHITTMALLNTAERSLKHLMAEHEQQAESYRKML